MACADTPMNLGWLLIWTGIDVFGQFLIVCFGHLIDGMLISLFTQIGHPCHLCDHEPWPRGGGSKNYSENQNGRLLTKYASYKKFK